MPALGRMMTHEMNIWRLREVSFMKLLDRKTSMTPHPAMALNAVGKFLN